MKKRITRVVNNRGFSLIELIIVIAIMAIIIAIMAPQFVRYVEKSKKGKDYEVVGVVQQAINVAMADTSIKDRPNTFGPSPLYDIDDGSMPEFATAVKEYIGTTNLQNFNDESIKSNTYRGNDIIVEIDAITELVRVKVNSGKPGVEDILIE